MNLDVLYLAWNRLEFTKHSFEWMTRNTDWNAVERLVVYDDTSTDGTREWLEEAIRSVPVEFAELRTVDFKSPPAVMNHYVSRSTAKFFAKIDNDIVVPPGWLQAMMGVYDDHPDVELLGMEAGRLGVPRGNEQYEFEPGSWTGGVGVFRRLAFSTRPKIKENGRFGFTEWQRLHRPVRGWIRPDLMVSSLDQIPFEPWSSLSAEYIERGWQRHWPPYDERWTEPYWGWWR